MVHPSPDIGEVGGGDGCGDGAAGGGGEGARKASHSSIGWLMRYTGFPMAVDISDSVAVSRIVITSAASVPFSATIVTVSPIVGPDCKRRPTISAATTDVQIRPS